MKNLIYCVTHICLQKIKIKIKIKNFIYHNNLKYSEQPKLQEQIKQSYT